MRAGTSPASQQTEVDEVAALADEPAAACVQVVQPMACARAGRIDPVEHGDGTPRPADVRPEPMCERRVFGG